jgi:cell shape-determining protein MreC
MSYHFRSSREDRRVSKKLWHKLGLAAALFLVCIFFLLTFPRFSGNVVSGISYPFVKTKDIVVGSSRNFWSIFASKAGLSKENNDLKEQLIDLKYKLADRDALALQNTELLALGQRPTSKDSILVSILEKPPQSPYDTFTIDAGQKQGVKLGEQLEVGEGVIIGKITEVFSSRARAVLYSSSGQKIQAVVGKNHVSAEASGRGGGNFSIELPRGVPIQVGDVVMATQLGAKVFGAIEKIDLEPNDSFQTLYFRSPVNMQQLYYAKVIPSNE